MIISKALSKRERIILFATLGLIALSLMLNFILLPFIYKYKALNRQIVRFQLELRKSNRLMARAEGIREEFKQVSSLAQVAVGQQQTVTLVLGQIEQLANQAGLRIIDIRPQAPRELGQYKEAILELRQEGSMQGFLKFLYDLENPPYLLRVKKLQLSSKVTKGLLQGQLLVSKIYLPSK